jgi:uncharacterized membrane protein
MAAKKRCVLTGALFVVLVLVLSSCGTATGNINGRVVDADGSPVEAATVQVAGMSVLTDQDGNYSMSDIPAGEYRITATKTGVGSLTSEVTVRAAAATTFDMALMPAAE